MKKIQAKISLLLALIMLLGVFASCTGGNETVTTETDGTTQTEGGGGSDSAETDETDKNDGDDTEEDTTPKLDGNDAELIERADILANGVLSYHSDFSRENYVIANKNAILNYQLAAHSPQLVTSLTDKSGNAYLSNTMDVFVRMKDGKTYYASDSLVGTSTNIYRLGYYYYETRLEDQMFIGGDGMVDPYVIDPTRVSKSDMIDVSMVTRDKETITFKIEDRNDPSVAYTGFKVSTADYKYLEVTIKCNSGVGSNAELFLRAGSNSTFTSSQRIEFGVSSDGQFHTYTIPLETVEDYTGYLRGIRLDINGAPGSTFEISDIRLMGVAEGAPGALYLNRSFLTFSDKMHQIIQVAASKKTENIEAIGMQTKLESDKVAGVVIKDRQGLHYSIEDKIAWNTVQYVGFLIKDVGVLGYMLPYDGKGGTVRITLEDGYYVVEQRSVPDGWTIYPSEDGTGNSSDFYLGQRIYTDTEDDFERFIYEAECEVNPLPAENVIINPLKSGSAKYLGYDSLHGVYKFTVDAGGSFSGPYFNYPNRHFGVEFDIKGDDKDRNIYVMTYTTDGGLECAAILNDQKMMLPIPIEVSKNFKGDGENTIFMKDDATYGETYIPLIVKANSTDEFTILNLYQNWGRFPLKQISSIQYFSPYYHLSLGVTETNCVVPYGSNGLSLPDFRSMSAPLWKNQPQHNSCGAHSFVRYTDSDGVFNANQLESVVIDSYGPTYADMTAVFVSDDENIRITYNHMEQPHSDENRTFYQLRLEVLGDVSINNFKEDFYFYSVSPNDPTGIYQRVGYLNEANESVVVPASKSGEAVEYKLGDHCPYFSFFDMDGYTSKHAEGYSNVAMLIYDSEFIIGGEKRDAGFVLRDMTGSLRLTLDLGETTLKAGDSLTVNGILLPWGSQEMEGSYDELQDKNVRDVRADSLLNPLKVTPVENCEKVHNSVGIFLPEVKSTNGKSATFTLSGGNNNNAVRIYGFDKLTVPVIEELVGGEWQTYEVSSINNRDQLGYGYSYDGYNVFYDGDGTYSYSFVAAIDNGAERTFRITVEDEFEGWGEEDDPTKDLPLNVYVTPDNISSLGVSLGTTYGCTYEINFEENFFRFYGDGKNKEGYLNLYSESPLYPTTGQYFVFKYRIPTTTKTKLTYFDIFASTEGKNATGVGDTVRTNGGAIKDGQWHVMVVDLSDIEKFNANEEGNYIAKFLRFDVLNGGSTPISAEDYVDIAYYGFSDNLDDIRALNSDETSLLFYKDSTLKKINVESGEVYIESDPINLYFDPSEIASMSTGGADSLISSDGTFVRFSARGAAEGYVFVYENASASKVTGQYLAVKYRVPKSVVAMANDFEIFASTEKKDPTGDGRLQVGGVDKSGEWRVIIVDLSRIASYNEVNGSFSAKHIRFDVINGKYTSTEDAPSFIDVAYFGLHDNLSELLKLNDGMEYVTFVDTQGTVRKLTTDGEPYEGEEDGGEVETDPPAPPAVEGKYNVEILPSSFAKPSGCNMTVAEDGSWARFTATGAGEAFLMAYKNTSFETTGKYFVVKYKIPVGVTFPTNFQIYASTQNTAAEQNGGRDQFLVGSILPSDEWQLLIIDLSQISTFTANNGQYAANYVRFDVINGKATHSEDAPSYIDIEFFAIHDSITEILAENTDLSQAVYVDKNGTRNTISTDGSFKEPEEEKDRDEGDPLNVFATPDEMDVLKVRQLAKSLSADGKYFTYTATGGAEGSVWAYKNSAGDKATGRYFVFKYRVPADSVAMPGDIEIFASTVNSDETAGDSIQIGHFISDGEWHVAVIDLSRITTFNEKNGEYFAKYIRFDIINGKRDSNAFIDVAYFGIHDDLNEICALNSDMETLLYVDAKGTETFVDLTPDAQE